MKHRDKSKPDYAKSSGQILRHAFRWYLKHTHLPGQQFRIWVSIGTRTGHGATPDLFWLQEFKEGAWVNCLGPSMEPELLVVAAWKKRHESKQRNTTATA